MNHSDHVYLLQKGIPGPGGVWADLGSGSGAFTLALADLLGPTGHIYSVDKNGSALREQERVMRSRFPNTTVHYLSADFSRRLDLPPLDGIVMANSLHYVRKKEPVLQLIRSYLKIETNSLQESEPALQLSDPHAMPAPRELQGRPAGRLLIVEYNADRGNMWVPYPFSYRTWEVLAGQNGFSSTQLLATVPSSFFGEIYSAASM